MKPIYLIHKHASSHLHYDLRLEDHGVLKSWAIPKEPPRTKGIKRLAVQVDDHPIEYAKFEGVIKEGYGKGKVEIWDNGWFETVEKNKGKWIIHIHGKKITGLYALIEFRGPKNWLFFKMKEK